MKYVYIIFVSLTFTILVGCSTLARMSMQHAPLADGTKLTAAPNLKPTSNWHCTRVKRSKAYDWNLIRAEARKIRFSPKTSQQIFIEKLAQEVNIGKFKANYVDMLIPESKSISVGNDNFSVSHTAATRIPVYAVFYQCQRLNPDGKIAYTKRKNISIGTSSGNFFP